MTDGKGPLNGIRVMDLGRHPAGPPAAPRCWLGRVQGSGGALHVFPLRR